MKPARLEFLSDGIFAIVMTILVLDLKVPHGSDLLVGLADTLPRFLAFASSFILLSIYWTGHHIQTLHLKKIDFTYQWINFAYLFVVCLIPFTTALLGDYPFESTAIILYGINLILAGALLYKGWVYAITDHRLVEPDSISREQRINARTKVLLPPIFYLLAILVAFFSPRVSLWLFGLGPLVYFIPIDSKLWNAIIAPFSRVEE